MKDAGLEWYEYMQHTASAYRTPLSIAFAFVATHNHFVLDRGGKVFKQVSAHHQAASRRDRRRPLRTARTAQQLDRLLLDEANVPQQR
ncbi:MAG UNVERIFIED_CONTAM: hypothetical protein LVR18_19215 [Planctomycetaceae bacterium]|jgi:hypothetical protein